MKKFVSLLLAIVMIVSIFPAQFLSASAAEVTESLSIIASTGTLASDSLSISWTSENLSFTANKNTSTSAIRTSDTDHFRLYVGFSATLTCTAGNITKIVVTATSSSYATDLAAYATGAVADGTTVTITPTESSDTYTISSITSQTRISSIAVTYSDVDSSSCAHENTEEIAAVEATCTTAGNTAGVKCTDCGTVISGNETIAATGHTEIAVVTAPTCTEDGYTTYTCSVCSNVRKSDYVDGGHTYVDGVCSVCSDALPTDLAGKYYIAAIRSSGNYMYLSNDLGAANTERYTQVDSGLTELPESITEAVDAQVFELIFDESTYTYKIKSGEKYLGWTSGNSGTLVEEASAIAATVQNAENNTYNIYFTATDKVRYLSLNSSSSSTYFAWYGEGQISDLYLIPVVEAEACAHENQTTTTVDATCTVNGSTTVTCDDCGETISTTVIEAAHNYVDNVCSVCGAEFEGEVDTTDPTEPTEEETTEPETTEEETTAPAEAVKIVFELGDDGSATHNDGSTATTYSETVDNYTLSITDGVKMYTGAIDATGNGCIKLGTSSVVGGFTFTAPDDVIQVVICVAGYKANTAKIEVNSTAYTITSASNNGAYTEITVDTSSTKTVTLTTVSGGCRAMVNSITYICGETDHTCQWDEGVVTTAATCTTDGVLTYSCTVEGCTITKTEKIDATGHSYNYSEASISCSACDYSAEYTLSTIATAKAASGDGVTYYIKGIVTYVSGKNVYIEDSTGAICVYFAVAPSDIAVGDEVLVWDTITTYNGLIETTNTTDQEFVVVSSGNELPCQTVTIDTLLADTTNEYLCERVLIENVRMGVMGTNKTPIYDDDNSTLNIYGNITLDETINEEDTVNVTAIVSTYNAYQLLLNPGTAAADVVEVEHHDPIVLETVEIATAKAGEAGTFFQVEGTVTYVSGRNVYIQDATGGIVVYLTADATTTQVGDMVRAYGALKIYNGLIELDSVDETNSRFYEIQANDNTVDAQTVTIEALKADTTNEYLAEKITLENVYVSYYSYSSSYGNVTYTLIDGNGNTIQIYRTTVSSKEECVAGGSIVTVEAVVSTYNGYQLLTSNDKITVTGTCAHENTTLVNYVAPTYTTTGKTGNEQCNVCQNYTTESGKIDVLDDPVNSWNITLKDDIAVNFQIDLLETDVVKVTVAGEEVAYTYADDSLTVNVAAAQMMDEIAIYVNDMILASTYTVRGYADVILAGEYDDADKALVKAMLHYGAAAQTAFGYNAENLANNGIEAVEVTVPAERESTVSYEGEVDGVVFYGASLSHRNKTAVRFYFTGANAAAATYMIGETAYEAVAGNGMYYIEVAGIMVQDLDEVITVVVNETLTVTYSPMDYIVRMYNKYEDGTAVKALVQALYGYYEAAEAYLVKDVVAE